MILLVPQNVVMGLNIVMKMDLTSISSISSLLARI